MNQPEGEDTSAVREQVMGMVRGHFRPEFLNRVDEIILFHRLAAERDGRIVEIQFARLQKLLTDRKIVLTLDAAGRDWLAAKGWDPAYGARPLKRVIQRHLQDPLAEMILGRRRQGRRQRRDLVRRQRADLQRQGAANRGDRPVRGAGGEAKAELSAALTARETTKRPGEVNLSGALSWAGRQGSRADQQTCRLVILMSLFPSRDRPDASSSSSSPELRRDIHQLAHARPAPGGGQIVDHRLVIGEPGLRFGQFFDGRAGSDDLGDGDVVGPVHGLDDVVA